MTSFTLKKKKIQGRQPWAYCCLMRSETQEQPNYLPPPPHPHCFRQEDPERGDFGKIPHSPSYISLPNT